MYYFDNPEKTPFNLVMDMEHETPKKLVVHATHGDGEPPKILDARYVKY